MIRKGDIVRVKGVENTYIVESVGGGNAKIKSQSDKSVSELVLSNLEKVLYLNEGY